MQEILSLVVTVCLVAILRKLAPSIDGPARVGLALALSGAVVSLAVHFAPLVLAMLPPAVSAALVGAAGSFVAMGGVELARSFAGRVDIDARTIGGE